jgi:hypothetical protein
MLMISPITNRRWLYQDADTPQTPTHSNTVPFVADLSHAIAR